MFDTARVMAAVALWTISAALMIVGTIWKSLEMMGWGGWTALVACMVTGWIVADCAVRKDRLRVREIARLLREKDAVRSDLPRVPR